MASSYALPVDSSSSANGAASANAVAPCPAPPTPPDDAAVKIPRLRVDLGGIDVLREAGRFPCLARFVVRVMGFETCGTPMRPWQRCKHVVSSLFLYSSMGLGMWMLTGVVFGFSDTVAIAVGAASFANFMLFVVPTEQVKWGDVLLGDYVHSRREKLMAAKHTPDMIASALFPLVMYVIPVSAFVLPQLFAADVDERLSPSAQAGCWACLVSGIWVVLLFAGWGPLYETVLVKSSKYLTGDLVTDYADRVLAVLCDGTSPVEVRRERLTALWELRGQHIQGALRRSANVSSVAQFPFCLVWVFIGVFWLVPDLVGGLPNSDRAVVPHPALRIILAAFMLLSVIRDMGYGLLKQMSQPSSLFEERLRSEISPHAAKLAVAVQLFDGRSEELWKFVHAQGIWLSVMGIAVDSRLPGKVAPVMASIVGAVAWALARSL